MSNYKKKLYTNDKEQNLLFELTKNHGKRKRNGIYKKLKAMGVRDVDAKVSRLNTKASTNWWD